MNQNIRELLTEYVQIRNLRTAEGKDLAVPRTKLVVASRAFSVTAPRIWNTLPPDVTGAESVPVFRNRLKTHFFNTAYKHYTHSTSAPMIRYYVLTYQYNLFIYLFVSMHENVPKLWAYQFVSDDI